MDLNATYAPDAQVSFQKMDNSTVIVHLDTGRIHHTNATGSRIWELLSEGHSLAQVLDVLGAEFHVERECLQQDVLDFVEKLTAEKMIYRTSGGT